MCSLPVADEHHLDRHGGEATSNEAVVGHWPVRRRLPLAHGRRPPLDPDLAVDLRKARGLALDRKAYGRLAVAQPERGRQGLLHPPIGVLIVGLEHQVIAVATDLISLLPGRFLKKMEDERSALDDRTFIARTEARRGAELGQESNQENRRF